jgi:prepilin-type N-terminal cleavage/methylation domain-containing protein
VVRGSYFRIKRNVMKSCKYEAGFTLVEMLIVVAIIALLATMVVGLAGRIDNQSKERALKSTFALLDSALQEYYEYTGEFPVADNADPNLNSEILYAALDSVPPSRTILEKVNSSLIQNNFNPTAVPPIPEIYDPWWPNNKNKRRVLDYRYALGDTFPKLISSGPDRSFGTADDISSR